MAKLRGRRTRWLEVEGHGLGKDGPCIEAPELSSGQSWRSAGGQELEARNGSGGKRDGESWGI